MRIGWQILLFIVIAPICAAFGVFGGCLAGTLAPSAMQSTSITAGMITGAVGGLVVAGLIVWNLRLR
jgi:hypothetical protein